MIRRKVIMSVLTVLACLCMTVPAMAAESQQIIRYESTTTTQEITEDNNEDITGTDVTGFAKRFLGGKYRYSGSSLTNGTDCSGFTMAVYDNFGISLPHSSRSQRSVGTAVRSLDEAEAGDLICYSGHVALYLGDGQIIHAQNAQNGIVISNAGYNKIVAIRRVLS